MFYSILDSHILEWSEYEINHIEQFKIKFPYLSLTELGDLAAINPQNTSYAKELGQIKIPLSSTKLRYQIYIYCRMEYCPAGVVVVHDCRREGIPSIFNVSLAIVIIFLLPMTRYSHDADTD